MINNNMYLIKNVDIKSFARIYALLITLTCLIPWLISAFFFLLYFGFFRTFTVGEFYGNSLSFSYFLLPLLIWLIIPLGIYAISLLLGLLFGWLYNIVAERFGGLKINIVLEKQEPLINQ